MKALLVFAVVAGIIYYFFQPTINSIIGKATNTYQSEVQSVKELSE